MAYELYWISGSPFAWRVQLALAAKGLDYESHRLNPAEGEHKSATYLAVNPRGKVPTLVDGGTVIRESAAILAYLEAKHPEPPLFGQSAAESAHVWQLLQEVDFYLQQPVSRMIRPIFFGQLAEQLDAVRAAAEEVHGELATVDGRLGEAPYLAGDTLSAADLALMPALQGILRAMGKPEAVAQKFGFLPVAEPYPNLARWAGRIEALPGYADTFPPHWR